MNQTGVQNIDSIGCNMGQCQNQTLSSQQDEFGKVFAFGCQA